MLRPTRFCVLLIRNIIIIYLKTYILIEIYKSKSFKISFFFNFRETRFINIITTLSGADPEGGEGAGAARPPLFVP